MAIMKFLRVGDTAELKPNGIRWIRIPSHVATNRQSGVVFESQDGTPVYTWFSDAHAMYYKITEPTSETDGTIIGDSATGVTSTNAYGTDNILIMSDGVVRGTQLTGIGLHASNYTMTLPDGAGIAMQESITFGGTTTENHIKFPDSLADALAFENASAVQYLKFNTSSANVTFGVDIVTSQDLVIGDVKTIGSTSAPSAITIAAGGGLTLAADLTCSEDIVIADGKLIGSATKKDTITISSAGLATFGYAVTITGAATCSSTLASGALTVTGAASTTTTMTVGTDLTVTAGDVDVVAGFIAVADDEQIQLGDQKASDSYIQFDSANNDLEFYDVSVGGPYTLTELLSGTPLNPVVVGDLTISDGQFDWTNATAGDVNTWTFASTGTNCIDIVANQQDTGNVLDINADNIGTGTFVHLDTDETSGFTGEYIDCYSGSDVQDFVVKLNGVTTITGVGGGTAAFTLTKGDIKLTDGVIDSDVDSAHGHNFTTSQAGSATYALLTLLSSDSAHDEPLLKLDSASTTDINTLEIVNDGQGYGISIDDQKTDGGGLEILMKTASTGNGIYIDGATGTYVGSNTTAMLNIQQTGTLANAAATALLVDFDGAPAASGMGYAILLDDNASAVATSYAMSINSNANVPLHLKAIGATKSALVVETNAQTVSSVIVDGATNNWQGANNVAMVHASSDAALGNAGASLIGAYHATAAPVASAIGFLGRFIDTAPVCSVPPAYCVEINSTNNYGLRIVTDIVSAKNLVLSGKQAQAVAIIDVVGSTGTGWDGATGIGMVNLSALGAHGHANASLLNITDATGASIGAARGSCLRMVDTTTNGADSWVAYLSSTANDGLLITTALAAAIDLKLSSSAAGTAAMFDVDGTTGHWVGANDVGMVDVHSDGVLIAGGNLLRLDSSGANNTNSHVLEIIASGAFQGSTSGTALNITDTGATAGTSYAAYISSTSNEALHVDAGTVQIDEDITIGVNSTGGAGHIDLWDGAGTNTPAYIKLASTNGTVGFFFMADNGTLRYHTAIPTANGDGSAV